MSREQHKDIRIGTLVGAGMDSPSYIRQILPNGFESFSLTFWQSVKGIEWNKLADEVAAVLEGSGAVISSLAIFGNPLERDDDAAASLRGWEECIDHAGDFGCDIVAGFTGRERGKTIPENIPRFAEIFGPLSDRAGGKNVRIAFENCSMGGTWQSGDWNIAHNPAAWELMFEALPRKISALEGTLPSACFTDRSPSPDKGMERQVIPYSWKGRHSTPRYHPPLRNYRKRGDSLPQDSRIRRHGLDSPDIGTSSGRIYRFHVPESL